LSASVFFLGRFDPIKTQVALLSLGNFFNMLWETKERYADAKDATLTLTGQRKILSYPNLILMNNRILNFS